MAHIENFWLDTGFSNKNNRSHCCGCSACESICGKKAITMHSDQEGFMYPKIDENRCVDCGLCVKVCPVLNECSNNKPFIESFGGYSTNKNIIQSSASGGIATALSISVIQNGGVVFGVQFNQTYSSAEYVKVETIDRLWNLCSSKYVQPLKSGIHNLVKNELLKGRKVLFVGCPCDVAGLKRYLRRDYDNLLTCELFCAGVTTDKLLVDYRNMREKKIGSKLIYLNVRDKDKGWFVQHLKEKYENGKVFYKNHYGTYLGYGFLTFRRPSCYHCQYKQMKTYCDIKVGDFWGIKDTDPFWNPNGVSVILVKTEKGSQALKKLDDFKLYEVDYTQSTINNHGFMSWPGQILEEKRNRFGQILVSKDGGLVKACKKTAPLSFWVKYYVPSSFHTIMKKIYHKFIDKS